MAESSQTCWRSFRLTSIDLLSPGAGEYLLPGGIHGTITPEIVDIFSRKSATIPLGPEFRKEIDESLWPGKVGSEAEYYIITKEEVRRIISRFKTKKSTESCLTQLHGWKLAIDALDDLLERRKLNDLFVYYWFDYKND